MKTIKILSFSLFLMIILLSGSVHAGVTAVPEAGNFSSRENQAGEVVSPVGLVAESQPKLFFRERTFGETEVAYLADTEHLYLPSGVSVDSEGNLWIAEAFGERALKYGSNGTFLMSIGVPGVIERADETHLSGPGDIAVDTSGNVWVVDGEAHRVVKFNAQGVYQAQLGQTFNPGTANSQFYYPNGIAFDSDGNIYVSDMSNHRIQVFDSDRFYLLTIGETDSSGSDNSHFNSPARIAIDLDDNLYIADQLNHRVQIYDKNHTYVHTLGVSEWAGSDNGHFDTPRGVAVDADQIYVADSNNHRIQIFDRSTYAYVATLGSGPGDGDDELNRPSDVAVDPTGNIYVADRQNVRVQKFNSSRAYQHTYGEPGVPYLTDGYHYNQPVDVAVDNTGNIAIIEGWGRGERLIKLDVDGLHQFTVGEPDVPFGDPGAFAAPFGVAFDAEGRIFVAECGAHRVQIFSAEGVWGADLGIGYGIGEYEFKCPAGIAFDSAGNIYVADSDNHRIQIFDSDRMYVTTLGETGVSGSDSDHFNWPNDVEIAPNGDIIVADTLNHRVQVFDSNRVWLRTLGISGECDGDDSHLCEPYGVAVDQDGKIYVAEKFNPRVQVYNNSGIYVTTIGGQLGTQADQFRQLYGVDVDDDGNVYIADLMNHRVEKYAPSKLLYLPLAVRP